MSGAPGHLECVQGGTRHKPGHGWDVCGVGERQAGKAGGAAPTWPGRPEARGGEGTGGPLPPHCTLIWGQRAHPSCSQRLCPALLGETTMASFDCWGGLSRLPIWGHQTQPGASRKEPMSPPWAASGQPPVLAPAFTWAVLHLPTHHPWLGPSPTSQAIWTNSFSLCLSFLTWTIRLQHIPKPTCPQACPSEHLGLIPG